MEDPTTNCSTDGGHGGAFSIDTRQATTRLCSWGANGHGQLGQSHTVDQLLPVSINSDLLPLEVQQMGVSCIGGGGGFSFIVTGNGRLLTCGNNDRGQLGLDESSTADPPKKTSHVSVFIPCPFLTSVNIKKAASGWDFMLALADNGHVYSWGSNSFGQLGRSLDQPGTIKQTSIPGQVVFPNNAPQHDIAAGLRHSLSVTEDGIAYAWGHAKKGQLGSEVTKVPGGKSVAASPQKVPCSVRLRSVFAGMYHSGGVDVSDNVFMWGCNTYGQCGISRETSSCIITPTKQHIPCKEGERVIAVCSGWTHLVARTDQGNFYSWGRSNLGQLGRRCASDAGYDPTPALVEGLQCATAHACGSEHNIALSEQKVYTWGWNEHGICATGDEVDVPLPRHVTSLNDDNGSSPLSVILQSVGCGTGHTFAIQQQNG